MFTEGKPIRAEGCPCTSASWTIVERTIDLRRVSKESPAPGGIDEGDPGHSFLLVGSISRCTPPLAMPVLDVSACLAAGCSIEKVPPTSPDVGHGGRGSNALRAPVNPGAQVRLSEIALEALLGGSTISIPFPQGHDGVGLAAFSSGPESVVEWTRIETPASAPDQYRQNRSLDHLQIKNSDLL